MNLETIVMKKVALILGFLVISFGAFAQEKSIVKRSDLKGPAYKNYKPWEHKTVPTVIYLDNKKKSLKGPASAPPPTPARRSWGRGRLP